MAHALLRLASQRFVLSRQGAQCFVKGNITGDIDFTKYKDIFSGSESVSLKDVPFASWVGLEKFIAYVLECNPGRTVEICDVGWNVLYSTCCIIKGESRLDLKRVELLMQESATQRTVRKWIGIDDLLERMRIGPEAPSEGIEHTRILAVLEILFGDIADARGVAVKDDIRRGLDDNGRYAFLVTGFHHCVLELSRVHLESIAVSALQVVGGIMLRLESAISELGPLGIEALPVIPVKSVLLEEIVSMHEKIFDNLGEILDKLNVALLAAQSAARGGNQDSLRVVDEALGVAAKLMTALCAEADAFGVAVFEKVITLAVGDPLKAAVLALEGTPHASDTAVLERLAEAFFVVDVFAAESWETLKPEIESECNAIDSGVMNLTIELQGFDAVRQVIEKRAKEIGVWLEKSGEEPAARREAVLAATSHKLVTQQERKAFALFFGELTVFDGSSVDTSEINFF